VDGTISPKVHGAFVWNVMGEDLMTNLESDPELKKPENAKIILDALDEVLKENKTKVVREESEGTTGEGKTESSHSGSQLFRTYAYSLGAVFVGEGAIRMGISLKRRFFSNEEQKRIAAEKASNCRRAIKALGTKEKWIARGKALGKRMLAGAFLSIPNYYAPVHSYRKKKWYKDPWSLWPIDGFKNDEPWAFSESFLQEEVRPYLLSLIK
ncbi:MAG: hypothetical protein JWQ35_813, partial [Bacteriovoracaceae bacterium]|nr:hypothetical protein [Bacteriovoracaceae bacterium]